MENISAHITYEEATHSDIAKSLGLSNEPNPEQLTKMKVTAEKIFEPLRTFFNKRIGISSFFRSILVNIKAKGSKTSQHPLGEAMDIDGQIFGEVTNKEIFEYIKTNLFFDQLIAEFPDETGEPAWIHASYSEGNNRGEILMSYKDKKTGKTKYERIA